MTHPDFSFGNALFHFRRTGGPKGFLWKYALAFALAGFAIQSFNTVMSWPIYEVYLRVFTEDDGDITQYTADINRASMRSMMSSVLIFPLGILFWMVFETASLRRYMRGDGFRLRVGADEWRVLVVGLIWFGLLIAAYIGLFIVILVPMGLGAIGGRDSAAVGAVVGLVLMLVYMLACLWAGIRLSPAAALTVRDGQIRFFEAWRVTRGRAGVLFGAWLVIGLAMMVVILIAYSIMAVVGFAQLGPLFQALQDGSATSADIRAVVTSPGFWGPLGLIFLLLVGVQAIAQHIFGGPAALAARTDPNWVGQPRVSDTFS
ncbi:hypothetical protein [Hyphomonas sp.]|uniref:hypothetical protein n=1 Tax=Hyphomonas sp. TaxID=87 RepID=UPI0032EC9C1F